MFAGQGVARTAWEPAWARAVDRTAAADQL